MKLSHVRAKDLKVGETLINRDTLDKVEVTMVKELRGQLMVGLKIGNQPYTHYWEPDFVPHQLCREEED